MTNFVPVKPSHLATEPLTLLLYGPVSAGKTHFLGSIGKDGVIISVGEGMATLKKLPDETSPDIITIRESPVDPRTGIFKTATGFDSITDALDWAIDQKKYTVIAIDDATFLSKFARNKAVELNANTNKSKALSDARSSGVLTMSVQDYGAEMNVIDWFFFTYIPIFRANNIHFVLVAHERVSYNKPERIGDPPSVRSINPAFTGQTFPDQVAAYFDLVWHLTKRTKMEKGKPIIESVARTDTNGTISAKTRYNGVFNELEINPTFPAVLSRINPSN